MRKLFVLFLLTLISLPAMATEWLSIGTDLYLDKDSVRYISNLRTYKAWVKVVKPKETVLSFNEYNLKTREWRNLDTVIMDSQNNIKKRVFNNHVGLNWLNVVPDTNSYYEFEAIKTQTKIDPKLLKKELHID